MVGQVGSSAASSFVSAASPPCTPTCTTVETPGCLRLIVSMVGSLLPGDYTTNYLASVL